ncbi:hypothetical protein D3C83_157350 [compost metagenome]
MLELPSQEQMARLFGLLGRVCNGRPLQAHAADAGPQSQDGRLPELRRAGHSRRQLFARATHRAGKMRSEQHPLPDDAGGR